MASADLAVIGRHTLKPAIVQEAICAAGRILQVGSDHAWPRSFLTKIFEGVNAAECDRSKAVEKLSTAVQACGIACCGSMSGSTDSRGHHKGSRPLIEVLVRVESTSAVNSAGAWRFSVGPGVEKCRGLHPVRHNCSCSTNDTVDGTALRPVAAGSLDNVPGEVPVGLALKNNVNSRRQQCQQTKSKQNLQRRGGTCQETVVQEVRSEIDATWLCRIRAPPGLHEDYMDDQGKMQQSW